MLSDYLIAPSLNSLFVTGILILFILAMILFNFRKIMNLTFYQKLSLLSIITLVIGNHGLIHLGVEKQYGFNPYKWV